MGFLDFLKKNRSVPDVAPAPVAAPVQPSFGNEVFTAGSSSPDAFLDHLAEEHDPADDLFSLTPSSIPPQQKAPAPVSAPNPTHGLPDDLFAVPKDEHNEWSPKATTAPVTPSSASTSTATPVIAPTPIASALPPRGAAAEIPDFSEEDIAAIEALERVTEPPAPVVATIAPVAPIGMDLPSIASTTTQRDFDAFSEPVSSPATVAPAPVLPSLPSSSFTRAPSEQAAPLAQSEDGFLSAEDYLTITDGIRASRRSLRKCDEAIRDASGRHDAVDAQYARAAADIASVEQRLRALDASLFGE